MKIILGKIAESRWMIFSIILINLLMHIKVFDKDLVGFHVWRQTQTQATILSFAEEDMNIFNPKKNERGTGDGVFRMEFPLAQWITAIPVKLIGHDVFVSRLMNFLFGLLSLFGTFYLIRLLFRSSILALLSVWILAFTPVFYYYTLNPMPDNLALTFNIWGLFYFFKWMNQDKLKDFIALIVLFSLSGLCKLPFALAFVLPSLVLVYKLYSGKSSLTKATKEGLVFLAGFLPMAFWYFWVIPTWEGNGIVNGIFSMDEKQKSDFWYYMWFNLRTNFPELIIGFATLPLFLTGFFSFKGLWEKSSLLSIVFGIWFLMIAGLIVFEMNMIETVHDYYLLPFLPIVILISVYGLGRLLSISRKKSWIWIPLAIILLAMPVYSYFRINPRWDRVGFNDDLLTYKMELREAVPDTALVCAGNDLSHHIFLYYINKKGWAFEQNWMGPKKLDSLARLGCEYLYCDSRHVDQNPRLQALFGTKVATFGEINIYKLINPDKRED